MPTLQDVAKRAGVSTATVSKVLSNTPYFTESTRQKVMEAVEELGYVPNLVARALAAGKTRIIAVVFPWVYDGIFSDPHTLHILEGIEAECRQQGYNILLSTPHLNGSGLDEHYLKLIQSGYIDGIIALDNVPFTSVLKPVHKKSIPVVNMGYHASRYYVRSDDVSGGEQLMEHILDLGHRSVGIIGIPADLNFSTTERMKGLRAAAEASGLDFDALPIAEGDFSVASGDSCAADLLTNFPELTALICLNDRMAMGAIQHMLRVGRRVPDDISVVGFDDIQMASVFHPPLTTISSNAPMLGREATRILFDIFNGQSPDPVIYPVELVVRQSSAPVNKGGHLE
jgi:DNA-binding LacI/PurR family transcriptional regulator